MALKTTLDDTKDRLDALLTYANSVTGAEDTSLGDAIERLADGYGSGGSSLPLQLELIGTWTGYLEEYTNTSTWQSTDTGISSINDTHSFVVLTVSCDGEYDSSLEKEWGGLSVIIAGKYSNGRVARSGHLYYVKSRALTHESISAVSSSSYGVVLGNSSTSFVIQRKCHATECPRIMGGNYTVNVYGIVGI